MGICEDIREKVVGKQVIGIKLSRVDFKRLKQELGVNAPVVENAMLRGKDILLEVTDELEEGSYELIYERGGI